MEAILKEPATRLHQRASTILEQTGSEFHISTLCRALHRLRFTNKKVSIKITDTAILVSQLSNTDKRNMLNHSPHELIFINETGIVSVAF